MTVRAAADGDRVRVIVVGDVDLSTVDILLNQLDAVMRQTSATVVDLGGVTFVDSTGLSALVTGPWQPAER